MISLSHFQSVIDDLDFLIDECRGDGVPLKTICELEAAIDQAKEIITAIQEKATFADQKS